MIIIYIILFLQEFTKFLFLFIKFSIIPKNLQTLRKIYFHNISQAESRHREKEEKEYYQEEIDKLHELLTRALDQLTIHDIKVSHLEKELTSLSFSFENSIRS